MPMSTMPQAGSVLENGSGAGMSSASAATVITSVQFTGGGTDAAYAALKAKGPVIGKMRPILNVSCA